MRSGMKMLLLSGQDGAESKYRDRRGREHRENGEYAVRNDYDNDMRMDSEYGDMYGAEARRRRDSRGRFRFEMGGMDVSEMRVGEMESRNGGYSGHGGEARMGGYPSRPFPVYEGGERMNQIGFARGDEVATNYRMNATHKGGSEMEYRPGSYTPGRASSSGGQMTKEMAEEWTRGMKNEDGTKGPHWKMEQVKQLMAQKGLQYDPVSLWVTLNMMYSDYCAVLKKHGVNTMDMYLDLACAFLNDSDVGAEDKLAAYYQYVVNG